MSIKAMTAVWDHSSHKGSNLLALLALADFAHDDGSNIYPSVATLCAKTRLSERAVQYILRALIASGELVADGKHASGTVAYRIDLERLWGGAKIAGARIAGAKIAPPQNPVAGGATRRTLGVQPVAPDPLVIHQEPSGDDYPARAHAHGDGHPVSALVGEEEAGAAMAKALHYAATQGVTGRELADLIARHTGSTGRFNAAAFMSACQASRQKRAG